MKKILIFSSYGGGGHISATDALKEYLGNDYDISTSYYIEEVVGNLSIIQTISFGTYSEEKFYNYCLKKKWTWFINKMYQLCTILTYLTQNIMRRTTVQYLKKVKPDLVISVIPIFNNVIKESCKECNIPFLLIPTDLDTTSFIKNITKPEYEKFKFALSFQNPDIVKFAHNNALPDSSRIFTGFPIKPSFFDSKDLNQIKNDFQIPSNKPILLVLMGAAGSKATYSYLLTLLQLKRPVHIILCLGRNEPLRKHLERIQTPEHITVSILSYTQRIADLMAISTLCITKAGTVSVCETMYMNVPMILDNTSTPLVWEKFNIDFVQKNKFGAVITHFKELNALVNKMLNDKNYYNACKQNLVNFPKKNFEENITAVIKQLLM